MKSHDILRGTLVVVPLLSLFASREAAAQDLATAEALFKKGISDMQEGKFETACPALAESNRIDPRAGTLFTLAECEAKGGKIATAVARYEDYQRAYAQMSVPLRLKHAERSGIAKKQIAALTPQIPQLTLALPEGTPATVRVTRDGQELSTPALGIALPVDPGEHVVTTQLPDGPVVEQKITLAAGEKKTLTLEIKQAEATPPPALPEKQVAPVAPKPPPPAVVSTPSPTAEPPSSGSGQRIGALVAGGIGVVGLGLGAATGIVNLGNKSTIDANCEGERCNAEGISAVESSKTMGTLSTVGFGVGIAGLATAAVLFFTAPSTKKTGGAKGTLKADVQAGPRGAFMGVKGSF